MFLPVYWPFPQLFPAYLKWPFLPLLTCLLLPVIPAHTATCILFHCRQLSAACSFSTSVNSLMDRDDKAVSRVGKPVGLLGEGMPLECSVEHLKKNSLADESWFSLNISRVRWNTDFVGYFRSSRGYWDGFGGSVIENLPRVWVWSSAVPTHTETEVKYLGNTGLNNCHCKL